MTDNEIIKALECCMNACKECPFKKYGEECAAKLNKCALDLINRQKAEIERLRVDLKYYLDNNEENGVVYIPKFVVEKRIKELSEGSENA